jgi:hypothetical protein
MSPTIHPTLKGSDNKVGPYGVERFKSSADRGFHPSADGLFMSLPCGSTPIATPGVQPKVWDTLSPWAPWERARFLQLAVSLGERVAFLP